MTLASVVRKITRLLRLILAGFVWCHALFVVDIGLPTTSATLFRWFHLSVSEAVIFLLLLLFSFIAGNSFWDGFKNIAYIFFFPFVLFFYVVYWFGNGLFAIGRWFHPAARSSSVLVIEPPKAPVPIAASVVETRSVEDQAKSVLGVLSRPFRRFTILWCFLLVAADHLQIVWLATIIVLIHVGRAVLTVVRLVFFSGGWFTSIEKSIREWTEGVVVKLQVVTRETAPTEELKSTFNAIKAVESGMRLLENSVLLERWVWLFGGVFLGSVYLYLGFLFSFAYYGIAKLAGIPFTWLESLVISMFIPFMIGDIPRSVAMKFLGGIHCTLIVSVGAGTLITYFRRRIDSIKAIGSVIAVRLSDQSLKEKVLILEEKFAEKEKK